MTTPAQHSRIYWAIADVLLIAIQLPTAAHLPAPQELRQRLLAALDAMVGKGREAGIQDQDLSEARYALTAFLDEQVFKSNWQGRSDWINEPLQLTLYRERSAGEHFFVRLRALLRAGNRPEALEAYYLCLAVGFRGVYAQNGDTQGLASFKEAARQSLLGQLPNPDVIAPHVEPRDRGSALRTSNAVVYAVVAACVLIGAISLVGLRFAARHSVDDAVTAIQVPQPSAN